MIGLKVNGGWLELPKKFRFALKRTSPIYYGKNFNIIAGAYSVPATIDASDQNRRLLKFPEFLNNQNTANDFVCALYFNGNHINTGTLNWKDAGPGKYKIQFFSSAGALSQLKEKTFADYDYGGDIQINAATVNDDYDWFRMFAAAHRLDASSAAARPMTTAALKVGKTLERVLTQENYRLETTFFDEEEYADLIFFKNFYFNRNQQQMTRDMVKAAPKQYVAAALTGLANMFCLAVDINSFQNRVTIAAHNDLLDNPLESIDMTSRVTSNFVRRKIRTSGKSLVKSFEFNHFDEYANANSEAEDFAQYNVLPAVTAIADLPTTAEEGDLIYVYHLGHYVPWDEDENTWDLDSQFQTLHALKISESGTDIKSNLVPPYYGYGIQSALLITASGRPLYFYNEDNALPSENGYLAFFDDTMQGGQARYDIYDREGNETGTKSLEWQGEHGLYENNWKKWLTYLDDAYEVEVEMQLTELDLFNWNPLQPIRIFDEHSGGYHYFYWVERKIVLSENGIEPAVQRLIQVTF